MAEPRKIVYAIHDVATDEYLASSGDRTPHQFLAREFPTLREANERRERDTDSVLTWETL